MGGIHVWYVKLLKRTISGEVTGPRGEVIFLSGHAVSVKLPSK